jgi:hypothetical protein
MIHWKILIYIKFKYTQSCYYLLQIIIIKEEEIDEGDKICLNYLHEFFPNIWNLASVNGT